MKKKREKMLFLGRFQPFHKGHLAVVRKFLRHRDVIIGLGSSTIPLSFYDPFTAKERREMIIKALAESGIAGIKIYSVPDIPEDKRYVGHVKRIIRERFNVVFSGNPWVYELFKEKGYKISVINEETQRIGGISATKIREFICENKNWEKFVPDAVAKYVKKINGVRRIKKLRKCV